MSNQEKRNSMTNGEWLARQTDEVKADVVVKFISKNAYLSEDEIRTKYKVWKSLPKEDNGITNR